jgi:outer membrane receptor protein involved in Fe transport
MAALQPPNGTLGDALRNIPSVDVDQQGVISLRGDSNVTVLVDGQPSALFQGPGRAQALQNLPADQYERVEVMTNPSAAFTPEGTGGIINLITKKTRAATQAGSLDANVDSFGGYRGYLTDMYSTGRLTASATAGFTHFVDRSRQLTTEDLSNPGAGQLAQIANHAESRDSGDFGHLTVAVSDDLTATTRLTATGSYAAFTSAAAMDGAYRSSAAAGALAEDYDNKGAMRETASELTGSAAYVHQLGGEDHEISVHLSYNAVSFKTDTAQTFTFLLPTQPDQFEDSTPGQALSFGELAAEYKGPAPAGAKLDAGYELTVSQDHLDNLALFGTNAADATPALSQDNTFRWNESVNALFATYQQPFGDLVVMPGVRVEEAIVATDQVTQRLRGHTSYFAAYPTLHLRYGISKNAALSASYSRRIDRPYASELNPFRVENGPLSFSQGNARLAPSFTDSYDLDYEYTGSAANYSTDLYYKDSHGVSERITGNLGGGALLNTFAGIGRSQRAGLEVVADDKIGPTLAFTVTGDVHWADTTTPDEGPPSRRSGVDGDVRGILNWTPTPADWLQVNGAFYSGGVTPQGHRGPFARADIGYQHKFSDRLAVQLKLIDPFNNAPAATFLEEPTLREETRLAPTDRRVSVSFTYAIGAVAKQTKTDFDFSAGAPPAP